MIVEYVLVVLLVTPGPNFGVIWQHEPFPSEAECEEEIARLPEDLNAHFRLPEDVSAEPMCRPYYTRGI